MCWAHNNSDDNSDSDIWLSVGNKLGVFDKPRDISNTPGISNDPALVADEAGRLAVVWSDTTRGANSSDILGRVSLDAGSTLSEVMDFSNKEGTSIHPDTALSGNKLFVVWEDVLPTGRAIKATCSEIKGAPAITSPKPEPKKPAAHPTPKSEH